MGVKYHYFFHKSSKPSADHLSCPVTLHVRGSGNYFSQSQYIRIDCIINVSHTCYKFCRQLATWLSLGPTVPYSTHLSRVHSIEHELAALVKES